VDVEILSGWFVRPEKLPALSAFCQLNVETDGDCGLATLRGDDGESRSEKKPSKAELLPQTRRRPDGALLIVTEETVSK